MGEDRSSNAIDSLPFAGDAEVKGRVSFQSCSECSTRCQKRNANVAWPSSSTWKTSPWVSRVSGRSGSRCRKFSSDSSRRAARRQEGLRRLEPLSELHGPFPRVGHRADRDSQALADRQELRRHPPGRQRHRPGLEQASRQHLRDRFRRLRLLSLVSKLKENGKHVIGLGMMFHLRPAARQLRRVCLLRRPRPHQNEHLPATDERLPAADLARAEA